MIPGPVHSVELALGICYFRILRITAQAAPPARHWMTPRLPVRMITRTPPLANGGRMALNAVGLTATTVATLRVARLVAVGVRLATARGDGVAVTNRTRAGVDSPIKIVLMVPSVMFA